MNNKIASPTNFFFIFPLLLSFSFQSCLSPRDQSIKEWERYEWKTLAEDNESNPVSWVAYARKVRNSKFKEFKIVGEINVPPEKAIRILSENNEIYRNFVLSTDKETGCQKVSWQEGWDEDLNLKNKDSRTPKILYSWKFVPSGRNKSIATYIIYSEADNKMPASKFNSVVQKELPKKLRSFEQMVVSLN